MSTNPFYGFACITNDGRICGSPFNGAARGTYFGDRWVASPRLRSPSCAHLAGSGAVVVVGGGSDEGFVKDYNGYLVHEDGRVRDLGLKYYNHVISTSRTTGKTWVAWYPGLPDRVRCGELDPVTLEVGPGVVMVPGDIFAGLSGIDDEGRPIWLGLQPTMFWGLTATQPTVVGDVTLAQGQDGGIVYVRGGVAGLLLPGIVTCEPVASPDGRWFVARGLDPEMHVGRLPPVPPAVVEAPIEIPVLGTLSRAIWMPAMLECMVDQDPDGPHAPLPGMFTDAGTNARCFTNFARFDFFPRTAPVWANFGPESRSVPPAWLKGYYGSIESAEDLVNPESARAKGITASLAALRAQCVADRRLGWVNIDSLSIADVPAILDFIPATGSPLRWVQEMYLRRGETVAQSITRWRRGFVLLRAKYGVDVEGYARFGGTAMFYTQSGNFKLRDLVAAHPAMWDLVEEFLLPICFPFPISRKSGVTSYPALGELLGEWIAGNGAGALPALAFTDADIPPIETTPDETQEDDDVPKDLLTQETILPVIAKVGPALTALWPVPRGFGEPEAAYQERVRATGVQLAREAVDFAQGAGFRPTALQMIEIQKLFHQNVPRAVISAALGADAL